MTATAQRRQPPVVPLTLTSELQLQQSPQQLSPTLSSPVSIAQVRCGSSAAANAERRAFHFALEQVDTAAPCLHIIGAVCLCVEHNRVIAECNTKILFVCRDKYVFFASAGD